MPSAFSYAMRHARLLVLTIAAAVVARAAPVRFDIPAQSAADALIAFTKQASTEVLFSFDDLKKVRARAVVGEFEPEESLRLLLRGTGFAVTRNAGKFVVAAVPAPLPKATSDPSGKTAKPENPANVGPREGGANDGRAARLARATAGLAESDPASRATVELSPFEVRSDKDTGYTATSTLAGSRINTQLRNTSAAISVFTSQFIEDTGALNVTEALTYALNGERDLTDFTGNGTRNNDLQLQFRGFVGASLGRNYFQWTLSSDSYNIERLDFARGPNSILFGIGGPGGILNTSTKRALIGQNVSNLKLRVGSWEDYRGSIDVARSVGDTFAVRVNAVTQDKKSWRDFEYQKRNQAALAATFRPFKNTELRLDAEIQTEAEPSGLGQRTLQNVAAARLERLALAPKIAGEPGEIGPPGRDDAGGGIGMGGDFLLVDLLRHAIERRASTQLRPAQHLLVMVDRHHLALRHAVHVDIARQHEFHAGRTQPRRQRGIGVG